MDKFIAKLLAMFRGRNIDGKQGRRFKIVSGGRDEVLSLVGNKECTVPAELLQAEKEPNRIVGKSSVEYWEVKGGLREPLTDDERETICADVTEYFRRRGQVCVVI